MKVFLRALELTDVEKLTEWRNNTEITSPLGGNTYFVSSLRETEWLKSVILNDNNNIRLAICLTENNLHIGNINITSINWINRSGEFSIMIGDKNQWSKGLGTEATRMMLRYAFAELNLHRIFLTVRFDNTHAIELYSKVGFKQEGVLRESLYKNNKYIDMILMSILKDEFND